MKHLKAFSWEFFQNSALILAFTLGFDAFQTGDIPGAAAIIVALVTLGALIIRFTEPFITGDHTETWLETVTNVLFFIPAIGFFCLYFSRITPNPLVDLSVGILAGVAASILQSASVKKMPSARHTLALASAFGAAVLLIRYVALGVSPGAGMVWINIPITAIIVSLEYRQHLAG